MIICQNMFKYHITTQVEDMVMTGNEKTLHVQSWFTPLFSDDEFVTRSNRGGKLIIGTD